MIRPSKFECIAVGLLIALFIGLIVGAAAGVVFRDWVVGLVVALSVFGLNIDVLFFGIKVKE